MTATKIVQLAKEIDDARCKGHWQLIPDLARRYKKHNPKGEIFSQITTAEASLAQLCKTHDDSDSNVYQHDSPQQISMAPRIDPAKVKSVQHQLNSGILLNTDDERMRVEKEFGKIVLARTYFECGDFLRTIELVRQLSFNKNDVKAGYHLVLFLQARTIKAISLEMTGNIESAWQSYEGIVSIIREAPNLKYPTLVDWTEKGLYRAALLGLREELNIEAKSVLSILRAYQLLTASMNISWRLYKRLVVTRYSLRFLSETYRRGQYSAPEDSGKQNGNSAGETQASFMRELSQLHAIYDKLVHAISGFPRAGQVNTIILDYVEQLARDLNLVAWSSGDIHLFIEAIHRAATKTFNSPSIMKHLFHALVMLGEYNEARYAFRAYLYLVGLTSQKRDEARANGEAFVIDKRGSLLTVPPTEDNEIRSLAEDVSRQKHGKEEARKSMESHRSSEKESVFDILSMLLDGVAMFCKDLGQGVDAVDVAEIAKCLYQISKEDTKEYEELGARVYRAAGSAYGLLANQTVDPTTRPIYHGKALEYLEQSLALDADSWETNYQLALQHCEMRNIREAVAYAKKAVQAKPTHIPSWHLLALACSCPVQCDLQQVLKICETGLQGANDNIDGCRAARSEADLYSLSPDYDELENLLLLQTTYAKLLDATEGPECALEYHQRLFATYSKIHIPEYLEDDEKSADGNTRNPMVISGSLGNLSEAPMLHSREMNGGVHSEQALSTSGTDKQEKNLSSSSSVLAARSCDSINRPRMKGSESVRVSPSTSHHRLLHPGFHLFRSRSYQTSSKRKDHSPYAVNNGAQKSNQTQASAASFHSAAPTFGSVFQQPGATAAMRVTTKLRQRQQRSMRLLCNLWLLSADCFLKLGRYDEALKAIEEAESIDCASNARVWSTLGRLYFQQGNIVRAITAFQKGLVCDAHDVDCRLWLAKAYMEQKLYEVAEGLLDAVTKGNGWDSAEAWYHLGDLYKRTNRLKRAKDCLLYALELEQTRPIHPFSVLPRCT